MLFKKYQKNLIENLIKYGFIKEVNFTIILLKNDNDIEMYPIHNEGKSVAAERLEH